MKRYKLTWRDSEGAQQAITIEDYEEAMKAREHIQKDRKLILDGFEELG